MHCASPPVPYRAEALDPHMFGWAVLVHHCEECTYNTPIEYSGTVWTREHTCNYCGSKSNGVGVAGESKGTMNSLQHDALAQLFARNMQLSQSQREQQAPPLMESLPRLPEKSIDSPVHFASAHYTHTAHVRSETRSETSEPPPPPPYCKALMPAAMAVTLQQNFIDPSALFPHQIDLFRNADYEQRLRLLELWRISPPSYPLKSHSHGESQWMTTSAEPEENAAQARYDTQTAARLVPQEEYMHDTHHVEPMGSIRNASELPAARTSTQGSNHARQQTDAEPYIVNGYEIASNKHSVDPVYAAGPWSAPGYAHAMQQQSNMQDQYGMYEQIRNHADWERMNERVARETFADLHGPDSLDDEMVM